MKRRFNVSTLLTLMVVMVMSLITPVSVQAQDARTLSAMLSAEFQDDSEKVPEENAILKQYRLRINKLNVSDLNSIYKAHRDYRATFIKHKKLSEDGFRIFRDFYKKVESANQNNIESAKKEGPQVKKFIRVLQDCEEITYLEINNEFIVNNTLNGFNFPLKELVILEEKTKGLGCDAGLGVSWEELRKIMQLWENFQIKYPNLLESQEEVENELNGLMHIYLVGMDNTPTYHLDDSKTYVVEKDLIDSYRQFVKKNVNSKYHKQIYELLKFYETNNYKVDQKLVDYLTKNFQSDFIALKRAIAVPDKIITNE
jgi:hypothetical protein